MSASSSAPTWPRRVESIFLNEPAAAEPRATRPRACRTRVRAASVLTLQVSVSSATVSSRRPALPAPPRRRPRGRAR